MLLAAPAVAFPIDDVAESAAGTAAGFATDSIQPIKVGEVLPDFLWSLPLEEINTNTCNTKRITLSDFRGKLIILDFWATWCGSCIEALPRFQHLNNRFEEDLIILPISNQKAETQLDFLRKTSLLKSDKLTFLLDGGELEKAFPYTMLPHEVWIDREGILRATTSGGEVSADNLQTFLDEGTLPEQKVDRMDYNKFKPLLIGYEIETDAFTLRSAIGGHLAGLPSASLLDTAYSESLGRYMATNLSLKALITPLIPGMLFKDQSRLMMEGGGSLPQGPFSYELVFPIDRKKEWRRFLQEDIERFFGFRPVKEERRVPVWRLHVEESALKERSAASAESTGYGNYSLIHQPLSVLLRWLNGRPGMRPVLAEGLPEENFCIELEFNEPSEPQIRSALEAYGIRLVPEERVLEMIILKKINHNQ